MPIHFKRLENPFTDEVFETTKSGLFPYVEEVFGWDDEFQQQRMRDDYEAEWFYWAFDGDNKLGYVCFKPYDQALHLHLILLIESYQGLGYGKGVMKAIHNIAKAERRDVTLSCFKSNTRAIKLYQSLNYEITEVEEHFVLFRLTDEKNIATTN